MNVSEEALNKLVISHISLEVNKTFQAVDLGSHFSIQWRVIYRVIIQILLQIRTLMRKEARFKLRK